METLTANLSHALEELVTANGCELVHSEFKGGTLRLVLDHPDGVTIDHCALISRQVSPLLDLEEFGAGRYLLEVSSPGLDRQLYRDEDYRRFSGRTVRVRFRDSQSGKKKTVVGELGVASDADSAAVTVIEADTGDVHRLLLHDIEVARLEIEP